MLTAASLRRLFAEKKILEASVFHSTSFVHSKKYNKHYKMLVFLIIQKIDMGTFVSEVKILMTQNEEQKTLSSIIINYYFHGLISKRIILPLIPLSHITILLSHSLRENSKASFPTSK